MGSLKPGATYIYERANGVTYARELGSNVRTAIGWDHGRDPRNEPTLFGTPFSEIAIYVQIHQAAKTNPSLHSALERAKITYYVGRDNGI